jgi:hypothetical protein
MHPCPHPSRLAAKSGKYLRMTAMRPVDKSSVISM